MMDGLVSQDCGGRCANVSEFALQMAFQPVVDIASRRIYGYEALVRGLNGESAATMLSQVNDDNRYAFDQACRIKAIETASVYGLDRRLNINFMPNAVYHAESCLRQTLAAASAYDFPPELITFEFTEDERIIDREHLKSIIWTYRQYGFRTALDDFGSGYAGLSLLADFQPDIIKIDRWLIANIDSSIPRQAIVSGVLTTSRVLGMMVIAEGVERPEELATLRSMGVTHYQGYLFARPALGHLIRDEDIPWP